MLKDPSTPDFMSPVSSQAVIPLICPIDAGLDSVSGPMNLPVGVSAGNDATYLNDGSFLLAGNTTDANNAPVLIHYNADGSLDSSFGTSGYLSGPVGGSALSATQLSNGEFLVSSEVSNQNGSTSEYVAEFTGAGLLDTSFGGASGQLIAPDGTNLNGVPQVMNNGIFLVSANTTDGSNTPVIVGYTSTGIVNNDFGTNGEIVAPAGVSSEWFYQDSTRGDIVVTDFSSQNDGSFTDQTTYYTTGGQLDTSNPSVATTITPYLIAIDPILVDPLPIIDPVPLPPVTGSGCYGTDGLTPPSGYTLDGGWQTLQDGTTLAAGFSSDGNNSPVLVDYNPDGSINTAFGNNGELTGPVGSSYLWASQNGDGTIQVQGTVANQDGSYSSFLDQFTSSGQVDTNFGGGSGSLTAPDGVTFNGDFIMLSDGDILAGATSTDGSNTPVVVDYTSSGVVSTSFGTSGEIVAPAGVTSEWFYQATDQYSGQEDIVVSDYSNNADGSVTSQTTYYSETGQPDPSNSSVTGTYPAPVYYTAGTYNMGNITIAPVAVMDAGVSSVGDAKSVSLQSENGFSTSHAVAASQPVASISGSAISESTASGLIVTPTFTTAAVGSVTNTTSHFSDYTATLLQNDGSGAPIIAQQPSGELGSSAAIASISALKLADFSENRGTTHASQDENPDFTAAQDSDSFQINRDPLDPSSTPQSGELTVPANSEADFPDHQEESKNIVASVTEKDVSALLARNDLVTTISLGLPDFLQ